MIERVDGLGISFKPPQWLRSAVSSIVSGKPATVPTPGGGTVTVTRNPTPAPSPIEQANTAVAENVPGGWLTIAAGAALALFVLPRMFRGRR